MTIALIHPLPGYSARGNFGWRSSFTENGVTIPAMLHAGDDLAAPEGTPILAAHDGVIVSSYNDLTGGYMVTLEAGNIRTRYLHMRALSPHKIGTRLRAGDVIGHVGNTGKWTTGAHLHFELWINGKAVPPMPYVTASIKTELGEDEMFILILQKQHNYLIVPQGSGKPRAILLGKEGNDNGAYSKLPVLPAHSAGFTMDDLKKSIVGIRAKHLTPVK
ncbi:MAG: M23 family metallopeptidase [Microbacteriaceae bacterium]